MLTPILSPAIGGIVMLTIPEIKRRIIPILKSYDVKKAYLFGSYARGEATEASDVDLRIDRGDSKKLKGLFGVSGFRLDLVDALGREVDLLTCIPQGPLSEQFTASLKRDEVLIYDHAQQG